MKNYPDSKCCYEYITLCQECVDRITWHKATMGGRIYRHIDISKPIVEDLPNNGKCEECGRMEEYAKTQI